VSQERTEELTALDCELARMAQETPDVPDDFHARWTEQVRAEAARMKKTAGKEARRQWRYILSTAAVFAFLIGGTLLTRNLGTKPETAAPKETVFRQEAAAGVSNTQPEKAEKAEKANAAAPRAEEEKNFGGAAVEEAAYSGAAMEEADFAQYEEAAEEAYEADAVMADVYVYDEGAAPAAAPAEEAQAVTLMAVNGAAAAKEAAADSAAEAEQERTGESAAEEPSAEENTAEESPAEESPADSAAAGADEAGKEAAEESAPFLDFLRDLGIFTLRTLGVAAACAAVWLIVTGIRRGRKKQQ